ATSGSVYFAAGQTSQTLSIAVIGDKGKESDETFFVNLSGAVNATLADAQGQGTILNDDGGKGGGKPHSATTLVCPPAAGSALSGGKVATPHAAMVDQLFAFPGAITGVLASGDLNAAASHFFHS